MKLTPANNREDGNSEMTRTLCRQRSKSTLVDLYSAKIFDPKLTDYSLVAFLCVRAVS